MQTDNLSLEKLIGICVNPGQHQWEKGWDQFLKRYKQIIYFFISQSCQSWNLNRLKIQLHDVSNDIFSEVIIIIFKKLVSFKNTDSERKFISWLQVICNRCTASYLQRKLKNLLFEDTFDDSADFRVRVSDNQNWELYENLVSELRIVLGNNKNTEKFIHIFMLKMWSGFSAKHILMHPCFKDLTENGINVIINRIREKLKKM